MARATQTFFIPESIRRLRLSNLPLSSELAAILHRLRVSSLGDLSGTSLRDFQSVSENGTVLFLETGRLIERARRGDFAIPPFRNAKLNPVVSQHRPRAKLVQMQRRHTPDNAVSEWPTDEAIFIPVEARGKRLATFPVSARLQHIFEFKHFSLFGDLHGLSFSEIRGYRNCGKKTIQELRDLVRAIQHTDQAAIADGRTGVVVHEAPPPVAEGAIFVPKKLHELNVVDLPLSVRLEGVLQQRGVRRLGDVHGVSIHDLRGIKNCGRKTISELVRLIERAAAGEFSAAPDVAWNPVELVRALDALVADLPDRDEEILILRLGGRSEEVPTLEEVGAKFRLTRERVRQVVHRSLERIGRQGGPRLRSQLEHVEKICCEKVLPLTPALLTQWLEGSPAAGNFNPVFYVRLQAELRPTIPAWPEGQDASGSRTECSEEIESALEAALRETFQAVPLPQALAQVRASRGLGNVEATGFLATLRHSRRFKVKFPQPDAPVVRLARRSALDVSRAVLQASDAPLTPEEILIRAHALVGPDAASWNPRTLGNALVEEKGFYLLGPRSYGLRQHFRLPDAAWQEARAGVYKLLKRLNRPASTSDILAEADGDWCHHSNKYELAYVLRGDERFIDLGRLLFGLAEWGVEERKYVKDLVPEILARCGRPLTVNQILAQLQQLRSVAPTSLSNIVRGIADVRDYGFGYFGLRSWGDSARHAVVASAEFVGLVIRRSEPPIRFARMCEILEIPPKGELADKLWQTCAALPDVLRIPDEYSPSTRLIHRSCRLERALVATAREVNRPLPLYEFQWELNERFGPLFASKSLDELRRALEQCPLFLRNAADEFILDVHLDQLGLDGDAIRRACAEILSESKEIVGCEDLLERLEADGKVWEELSPDILASLLRDDLTFQEVGRDRFRVKTCKH